MIDLVDNIGVLIDETVEIPDIDKEDEFIIQIHDSILNEGITYHLEEAGIILERSADTPNFYRNTKLDQNFKAARETAAKKADNTEADKNFKVGDKEKPDWDKSVKNVKDAEAKQDQLDKNFDDAEKADDANQRAYQMRKDAKNADEWTEPGAQSSPEELSNAASRTAIRNSSDSFWQKRQSAKEREGLDEKFDAAEKEDTANQRTYDMNKKADARYKEGEFKEMAKTGQGFDDFGEKDRGFMGAIADAVKANPLVALGGAVIAAAGGYLIYRYMNSIYRLNKATNYYSKLASSTSDPAKKAAYQQKASKYATRLESAKAKARENKKDYIAKTKEMQSRYSEMKKSGGDAKELAKMEKKLSARNKLLSKIGAI